MIVCTHSQIENKFNYLENSQLQMGSLNSTESKIKIDENK